MQNHRIISLYPETAGECPVSRTFCRGRAANFRLLADIVDLTVTAAIGVSIQSMLLRRRQRTASAGMRHQRRR